MIAEVFDIEFFSKRLDACEAGALTGGAFGRSNLAHLTELVLRELGKAIDLAALDKELSEATKLDLATLNEAKALFGAHLPKAIPLTAADAIQPTEQLPALESGIETLEKHASSLPGDEAILSLLLLVESPLMNLLIAAAADSNVSVRPLAEHARKKLDAVSPIELTRQWGRVQEEFNEDRARPAFDRHSSRVPDRFLDLASPDELRHKLSEYVFTIKPALIVDRISDGMLYYPMEAVGPARLLSLVTTITSLEKDAARLDLAHVLGRVAGLWARALNLPSARLAEILRLSPAGSLLGGAIARRTRSELDAAEESSRLGLLLGELRALLAIVTRMRGTASPAVAMLTRYKLGLEVSHSYSSVELKPFGEPDLQKHACRFLLEHGLYAEGTKFGAFETDLVVTVRALTTIVEAKRCEADKPTLGSIRDALAQLQDYMDKRPVRPQGVLIVYNFTNRLLVAPDRWLKGQYLILPINLGEATGSDRKDTLTLEEGQGQELVTGYVLKSEKTGVSRA